MLGERGGRPRPQRRVFFFQAEDGIRDGHVTGVQTCALPICMPGACGGSTSRGAARALSSPRAGGGDEGRSARPGEGWFCFVLKEFKDPQPDRFSLRSDHCRSEEGRVGKEGRSRWWTDEYKKK